MPTTPCKILVATSFLLGCLSFNFSFAAEIPTGKAENIGMSSERLLRINKAMQRHIDAGDIQGAVTMVARRGKLVRFETHRLMNVDADRSMQEDSLFIIVSSTKPFLGVATMMIEEGMIRPEGPVSKYIPEFADMQVAVFKDSIDENTRAYSVNSENIPKHRLVPAQRGITIHDLLTHTSGLASGRLGTATSERSQRDGDSTLASIIPKYGSYPLDFQPGARRPMKKF